MLKEQKLCQRVKDGEVSWFPQNKAKLTRWACEITMHVLLFSVIPVISHSVLSFLNCFCSFAAYLVQVGFPLVLLLTLFLKKGGDLSVLSWF